MDARARSVSLRVAVVAALFGSFALNGEATAQNTRKDINTLQASVKAKKTSTLAQKEYDKPVFLGKEPFTLTLRIPAGEKEKFARALEKDISNSFVLALDGATFGMPGNAKHMAEADSRVEIYFNAAKGARLDPKSAYYTGNFAFFGHVQDRTVIANIGPYMERQRLDKRLRTDEIKVTLVRVWGPGTPASQPAEVKIPFSFKKIRLLIHE